LCIVGRGQLFFRFFLLLVREDGTRDMVELELGTCKGQVGFFVWGGWDGEV
jgi:hypothetical protein